MNIRYKSKLDGTEKEFTEDVRRIKAWVELLYGYLELEKWAMVVNWDTVQEKEAKKSDEEDPSTEAEAGVAPEYFSIEITFYLQTMKDISPTWKEKRVTTIHEMLHAVLEEHTALAIDLLKGNKGARSAMRKNNERMVSKLSLKKFWEAMLPLNP
jgi:hypothetical protein